MWLQAWPSIGQCCTQSWQLPLAKTALACNAHVEMCTVGRHASHTSQARACCSTRMRRHTSCTKQHKRATLLTCARTH
eukprot:6277758-Alexandrium_andersonii.AAC.1